MVKNPRLTTKKLRNNMAEGGIDVSVDTVRRTLHAEGLNARTPRRTPLLKPHHKKRRLRYAKTGLLKPQKFWDIVLLTDETKLELFGPMDQRYVWSYGLDVCLAKEEPGIRREEHPAYREAWWWFCDAVGVFCL